MNNCNNELLEHKAIPEEFEEVIETAQSFM